MIVSEDTIEKLRRLDNRYKPRGFNESHYLATYHDGDRKVLPVIKELFINATNNGILSRNSDYHDTILYHYNSSNNHGALSDNNNGSIDCDVTKEEAIYKSILIINDMREKINLKDTIIDGQIIEIKNLKNERDGLKETIAKLRTELETEKAEAGRKISELLKEKQQLMIEYHELKKKYDICEKDKEWFESIAYPERLKLRNKAQRIHSDKHEKN
jgi:hypothetical protein